MNVSASAPGKVVLLGEYAVLEGAPAISTAVNRRAAVRVRSNARPGINVRAPDLQAGTARLAVGVDGLQWDCPEDCQSLALVDFVLRRVLEDPAPRHSGIGFDLSLDTSDFFSAHCARRIKLGLGSSAALTVACASAVAAHVDRSGAAGGSVRWLDRALEIHRAFQGGQGSGVDVATSLLGRTIIYQRGTQRETTRLRWPGTLHYRFVWSGQPASTPAMLGQLDQWRQRHPAEYDAHLSGLCSLAEAGAAAFSRGDAGQTIAVAGAYAGALRRLDAAGGLGIVSEPHQRLAQLAEAAGMVYKTCGAGGGDIGVALTQDPERLARFDADLVPEGFAALALTVDEPGLRIDLATAAASASGIAPPRISTSRLSTS